MAATGFGIALLLRKSREGDGYLSPPKIQNEMGFVFHHRHSHHHILVVAS